MNKFSTISDPEMKKLRDSGITDKELETAASLCCDPKEPFKGCLGQINVMFYIDRFGDFMSKNTKTAKIVQSIYNSLDKSQQQTVIQYIMDNTGDDDE